MQCFYSKLVIAYCYTFYRVHRVQKNVSEIDREIYLEVSGIFMALLCVTFR